MFLDGQPHGKGVFKKTGTKPIVCSFHKGKPAEILKESYPDILKEFDSLDYEGFERIISAKLNRFIEYIKEKSDELELNFKRSISIFKLIPRHLKLE